MKPLGWGLVLLALAATAALAGGLPPVAVDVRPAAGAIGVGLEPEIAVDFVDPDLDLDPDSIQVSLEDRPVPGTLAAIAGGQAFRGRAAAPLLPGAVGSLHLEAEDRAGNRLDEIVRFRAFDWSEDSLAASSTGCIEVLSGGAGFFFAAREDTERSRLRFERIEGGAVTDGIDIPGLAGPFERVSLARCPAGEFWVLAVRSLEPSTVYLARGDLDGFLSPVALALTEIPEWGRLPIACGPSQDGHLVLPETIPGGSGAARLRHFLVDASGVTRGSVVPSSEGAVAADVGFIGAFLHAVVVRVSGSTRELVHSLRFQQWFSRGRVLTGIRQPLAVVVRELPQGLGLVALCGPPAPAMLAAAVTVNGYFQQSVELAGTEGAAVDELPRPDFSATGAVLDLLWRHHAPDENDGPRFQSFELDSPAGEPLAGPPGRSALAVGRDPGRDPTLLTLWEAGDHRLVLQGHLPLSGAIPWIEAAGWADTQVSESAGGNVRLIAVAIDPDDDLESVELYFEGQPTGVLLADDGVSGDFAAGDGVFGLTAAVPPGVPAGQYEFQLVARDEAGHLGLTWPYLTAVPSATRFGGGPGAGGGPNGVPSGDPAFGWMERILLGPAFGWAGAATPGGSPPEAAPLILAAGFLETALVGGRPGTLTAVAWVDGLPPAGGYVRLFQGSEWLGNLYDDGLAGDRRAGDRLYTLVTDLAALPADEYRLELTAQERPGQPLSPVWPYLTVGP